MRTQGNEGGWQGVVFHRVSLPLRIVTDESAVCGLRENVGWVIVLEEYGVTELQPTQSQLLPTHLATKVILSFFYDESVFRQTDPSRNGTQAVASLRMTAGTFLLLMTGMKATHRIIAIANCPNPPGVAIFLLATSQQKLPQLHHRKQQSPPALHVSTTRLQPRKRQEWRSGFRGQPASSLPR